MSVGFPELILLCRWEVGVTSCVMTMTRWRSGSFFGVFSAGLLFTPPKLAIRIGVFCSLARVTGCLAWAGMCLRACKGSVPVLGRLWGKSESPAQRSVCVMTMTSTLNLGSFLLSAVCVECAWVARNPLTSCPGSAKKNDEAQLDVQSECLVSGSIFLCTTTTLYWVISSSWCCYVVVTDGFVTEEVKQEARTGSSLTRPPTSPGDPPAARPPAPP